MKSKFKMYMENVQKSKYIISETELKRHKLNEFSGKGDPYVEKITKINNFLFKINKNKELYAEIFLFDDYDPSKDKNLKKKLKTKLTEELKDLEAPSITKLIKFIKINMITYDDSAAQVIENIKQIPGGEQIVLDIEKNIENIKKNTIVKDESLNTIFTLIETQIREQMKQRKTKEAAFNQTLDDMINKIK